MSLLKKFLRTVGGGGGLRQVRAHPRKESLQLLEIPKEVLLQQPKVSKFLSRRAKTGRKAPMRYLNSSRAVSNLVTFSISRSQSYLRVRQS